VVLLPLTWLLLRAGGTTLPEIVRIATAPRTMAAIRLTVGCALAAALVNVVFGTVIAWVLARYDFPGRTALDAIVELPFALPTAVAGITLTFLYSEHGWFGRAFAAAGIPVAFTPLGIVVALTFVGLPFVVRTVEPVVAELDPQVAEAASSLGAGRAQTFLRVQLPLLVPGIVTGFALALARALGEYGSVLFISGNLPFKTEIAPLLIVTKLEQFDYDGAAVLASVVLLLSLGILVVVHAFERWVGRRVAGREVSA
jgi:sulfate/thiosulfate transport system permease protein